jgi:hypothetical protein
LRNNSCNFATFAAIRRAASFVRLWAVTEKQRSLIFSLQQKLRQSPPQNEHALIHCPRLVYAKLFMGG